MQTETKVQLPNRRIKKRYFVAALFIAAFSSSALIMPYKVANYIEMGDFCLEPFSGKDRIIQTTVKIKKDYRYDLIFSAVASHEGSSEKTTYSLNDQLPTLYGRGYYKAGTVLPYTFNFKKEWFSKGDNTELSLYLKFEDENRQSASDYELFLDTVAAGSITSTQINYKMFPFRRDKETTYASYFYGGGFFSERRYYAFNGTGFKEEYSGDHLGIVPLNEMHFTPTYYSEFSDRLSMSRGELHILDHFEDFEIGKLVEDTAKNRKYLAIPLELVHEKTYSYLRAKDPLLVKSDLRRQINGGTKPQEGWYETKYIFLPPARGFQTQEYNFRIVMAGTGECNMDTFVHYFKVTRSANSYGSKYNSDFFVREYFDV